MIVDIDNRDKNLNLSQARRDFLEEALLTALSMEGIEEEVTLSLSFVEGEEIRALNRDYRGVDQETDVLSFPAHEPKEIAALKDQGRLAILGDIVINQDRVRTQALDYGHSEDRESAYLAVHSLLHLLGYDHEREEDKAVMRAKEEAVMDRLGLSREAEVPFHSGYVTILGRPNVGKSTLLNALMGEKLTITSNKAQTTRNEIKLIYTDDRMQVIFTDTPGYQTPKNKLGEAMLKMSRDAVNGVDLVIYITDPSPEAGRLDNLLLDYLEGVKLPKICLINKADQAEDLLLFAVSDRYEKMGTFDRVILCSAKEGEGLDRVKEALYEALPPGPAYYPEDMVTDRPERFIVAELIREKCLKNLAQEVPHGIYVAIDQMTYRETGDLVDIYATIVVDQTSHKGIVIGKGGAMLKKIGTQARRDIEYFLQCRVNLKLWVKIEKNWRQKGRLIDSFGYGSDDRGLKQN